MSKKFYKLDPNDNVALASDLPGAATTNDLGLVKPDGTTITINNGVISAQGGGGGGGGGSDDGYMLVVNVVDNGLGTHGNSLTINGTQVYHVSDNQTITSGLASVTGSAWVDANNKILCGVGQGVRGADVIYMPGVLVFKNVKSVRVSFDYGCFSRLNGDSMVDGTTYNLSGDSILCYASGGYCLALDTLITMADGNMKMVKDIRLGDVVLTPFGPDKVVEASQGEGSAIDEWTFSNGVVVKTIGRHRFFNVELGEPMYLEAWNMGEHALDADGRKIELVKHERKEEPSPHATLFTEKWNLYYANGLLAGNRRSMGYEEIKS